MSLEILCSEAFAENDPERVRPLGRGSYLLSNQLAFAQSYAGACEYAPPGFVLPDDAQSVQTTIPILLLNGSDDPQDPPNNVAEAKLQMPNSLLVVATGQGHTVGNIGCLTEVVVDSSTREGQTPLPRMHASPTCNHLSSVSADYRLASRDGLASIPSNRAVSI